ncbi:hypothetical protein AB4037_23060 [Labrys sp. KB_33_2]|uniref:hypothetical protein n=1 Tax=Labrys sp. KB_33_2 TaxID=3237479 RepID=UPI003F9229C2
MTVLHPCHNCHRKADCSIRTKTLAALKGLSITKATLQCRLPQKDFPPGAVVEVKAFDLVEKSWSRPDDDPFEKRAITRRGVIRSWHQRKATVVLDKDQEIEKGFDDGAIGYLKVPSQRLTATGLPPVELCSCGLSQARCAAGDYPSVRGGKFQCGSEVE